MPTIDGAVDVDLTLQNESLVLFCDGVNWFILIHKS